MKNYRTLPTQAADFTFDFEHHDSCKKGEVIDLESPGTSVIVDIEKDKPQFLPASLLVDVAAKILQEQSVRFAIVTNKQHQPVGLIGLNDLQSAKVMSYARKFNLTRQEVTLFDLMVPLEKVRVMTQAIAEQATVGELISTLEQAHSPYLMITDNMHQHYTGVVFARRIERLLNFPVTITATADNQAEVVDLIGKA